MFIQAKYFFRQVNSNSEEENFKILFTSYSSSLFPSLKYKLNLNWNPFPIVEPSAGVRLEEEGFTLLAICLKPQLSPQIFGLIIANMEDASDSSQGVAPLINNVALPGSPPSLPVSVTGCKSHRVANKKVEARSEKLLPTALPPSEPKVDQKLPRSSERRGSGGGTRSPARSQAVAAGEAAAGGAEGPARSDPPGGQSLPSPPL
ncbi:uncharacterized protein LOC112411135 [Neophocaena asiaeorientalis asiaeorientalis]|uniref:Uncharacterized protein LOC112411135 n=1 Tax=Neophocaena asiaeorientalis asiaeorientalis TaxID=1706337 RepID=A0A341CSX5_NEOAA|nr:uncharacterized protein LOC112411135 [Neophocaena asiaeorientalis asiaeorientalis]XP_032478233.1 uncharacterized protein LOC116748853 [Phocoena sinus]